MIELASGRINSVRQTVFCPVGEYHKAHIWIFKPIRISYICPMAVHLKEAFGEVVMNDEKAPQNHIKPRKTDPNACGL